METVNIREFLLLIWGTLELEEGAGRVNAGRWESFHLYICEMFSAPVYFFILKRLPRDFLVTFRCHTVRPKWEKNTFKSVCQGRCWFNVRKGERCPLSVPVTGDHNCLMGLRWEPPRSFPPWLQPWAESQQDAHGGTWSKHSFIGLIPCRFYFPLSFGLQAYDPSTLVCPRLQGKEQLTEQSPQRSFLEGPALGLDCWLTSGDWASGSLPKVDEPRASLPSIYIRSP